MELAAPPFSSLLAGYIGGWEIVLVIAVLLIVLSATKFHPLLNGLNEGLREFLRATDEVGDEIGAATDTKVGGEVYEALTHDNHTAEFIKPQRSPFHEQLTAMILLLAQGFGIGRIPKAPGTFGTLLGLPWFALLLLPGSLPVFLLGTLLGLGLSVWCCGRAEKILGQTDPGSVVLDEITAIPVCFLPWLLWELHRHGAMPSVAHFFTGGNLLRTAETFFIFRVFDIWKPWPVRQIQDLPGGWGVTADDVLAAVYTGLIVLALVAL